MISIRTTYGVWIAVGGFTLTLIGAAISFYSESKGLSLTGFITTSIGVLIGFIGVIYGWIYNSKTAIKGSVKAAKELQSKLPQR